MWFAVIVGSVVLGLHWGILGVATCYAVATFLIEPVRTYITTRALGISFWTFARSLGGILQAAALMAVALLVTRAAFVAAGLPPAARLALLVLVGGCVYVGGLRMACARGDERDPGRDRPAAAARRAPLETVEAGL